MNNKIQKKYFNSKGQILSYDLLAAGFLLLIILIAGITFVNSQKDVLTTERIYSNLQIDATNAIGTMLSDTNCLQGGIVNEKRQVSQIKLDCVSALDYNYLKEKIGLEGHEYYFKIFDGVGTAFEKGTELSGNAIAVQRIIILNGEAKKGVLIVYE